MYKKATTTKIHNTHMYICVSALVCMSVSVCGCTIYGSKNVDLVIKWPYVSLTDSTIIKKIIVNVREKPMQGHFSETAADDLVVGIHSTPLNEK